ncbi:MAG: carboxypeptidase regulatory-like domain-containing protein [Holophagaceae bacterium]|nr:carboxypeptidase regulatory-like domain-containing protein [Holophagaceae bacterium]
MTSRHIRISGLIAVLIAAPLASPLAAQGVSAQLSGTVRSASDQALAGATVVIRNVETGFVRTVQTDATGRYVATALPVGPYSVSVTKAGFHAASNIKVNLNLGDAAPLNIKLAPESSTTVEVVAVATQVDTDRSAAVTLFTPESLNTLPVKGRGFLDFALLSPQVTISSERGNIAIGGQRGINTSINVDGGDYNDAFFGGTNGGAEGKTPFTVSIEAVREFQVITDGASAEFGRMGGGYLNAITKSGTNAVSGSIFYYNRPQSLVAKDHQTGKEVSDFKTIQYGGSVGGPIIKDKLFYFVAFDTQKESRPADFFWHNTSFDFNNPAALNPTTYPNDAALVARDGKYETKADSLTIFARLDWFVNADHSIQFRINRSTFNGNTNAGVTNSFSNVSTDDIKTLQLVGQWNWTIGGNWLNEFRVNLVKEELPRIPNSTSAQVTINSVGTYGKYPFTREFETTRTQISESLTYVTPTMQIKGGIDYNGTKIAEVFAPFTEGGYTFSNTVANGGNPARTALENFRLGRWSSFTQNFGLNGLTGYQAGDLQTTEKELAIFLQSDWRLNDSLKVGLGLRWDRQEHADISILDYSDPLSAAPPLSAKIPTDSQISPRLSFTWTPARDNGNTVVRGSLGSYVSRTPSVFIYQAFTQNTKRIGAYTLTAIGGNGAESASTIAAAAAGGVLFGAGFNAQNPAILSGVPTAGGTKPDIFTFAQDFKNPKTDRLNLGVERAFSFGWVFGLSGALAHTKNLERYNDINLGTPTLNAQGRLVYPSTRPNTNFRRMAVYASDAESKYSALTFSAKYNKENSPLQAQIFYTWAMDRDNDSNERNFSSSAIQDFKRLNDDYGYSVNDRRHVVTGYLSYLEKNWTGIQFGLNLRYLGARAYNPTLGDRNNDSFFNDRLIGTERNAFRETAQTVADLKISRDWTFARKVKFTVSGEVFNIFNHTARFDRVSLSGTDAAVTTTLTKTAISSPRQVQLGVRLAF